MQWIKTNEKLPEKGQKIEMTCKHWETNWENDFDEKYIEQGSYDEFGNFWDSEGCRLHDPSYWRPYQPERSKREDTFIYRPENYPGPVAIDCKPSKECDEYHKNAKVQINIKSDAVL